MFTFLVCKVAADLRSVLAGRARTGHAHNVVIGVRAWQGGSWGQGHCIAGGLGRREATCLVVCRMGVGWIPANPEDAKYNKKAQALGPGQE